MKKSLICVVLALVMVLGMAGCGGEKAPEAPKNVDMQKVYEGYTESLPEMSLMDETMMLNFCGIKKSDCKQCVVSVSSDGLRADEIWLIEANDEAAAENLEKLANTRLERKGEESITYSPEQYEIVKKAQVIRNGNYLAMIVSPDVEKLADAFRSAAGI